jgi:hypothetical protein
MDFTTNTYFYHDMYHVRYVIAYIMVHVTDYVKIQ